MLEYKYVQRLKLAMNNWINRKLIFFGKPLTNYWRGLPTASYARLYVANCGLNYMLASYNLYQVIVSFNFNENE